jgi:nitrate reductase NapAB chaperone NapD
MLHIASAVVKARPADQHGVVERIAALAGTDVVAIDHGRIIVVLESRQHGDLGDTLNQIAGLDGVLSATLVFEHSEPEGYVA